MAGGLRCDPQAGGDGGLDDVHHVFGGLGSGNGERPLVDGDVPGHTYGVVRGVVGEHDSAAERVTQTGRARVQGGFVDGHGCLRFGVRDV